MQVRATLTGWGCSPTSLLVHGGLWYAACGEHGVWILDLSQPNAPQLHAQHTVAGGAQSVFARDGAVWVKNPSGVEQIIPGTGPVTAVPPVAPGSTTGPALPPELGAFPGTPPAEPLPELEGHVVSTRPLEATISLGERDGLTPGLRIEFGVDEEPAGAHADEAPVVGTVTAVQSDSARVELGFGERTYTGQHVRTTSSPATARTTFRKRQAQLLEWTASLRPGIPVNELGVSGLLDAELVYRGERPAYTEVAVSPVGGMAIRGRDTFALSAHAAAGFDHSYFSVGIGAGVMRWSEIPDDASGRGENVEVDRGFGPSLVQQLRLGSRDGLHLRAQNAFIIYQKEIQFGALDIRGQVPFGGRTWAIARGSWGRASGYASFELGLRRLVRGDGGPGSLFVSPTAGLLGIDQFVEIEDFDDNSFVLGPMVGISVEGRL